MWKHIKTIFLVTMVTCIIWVFAESESLRPAEVRSVEVTFAPIPGAKYIIDLSQDSPGVRGNVVRVDVSLDGPAAAVDVVERRLRSPITVSPGMDGLTTEPGHKTIDLQTVLRNHPDLRLSSRGVTIKSVSPETVEATIDELVTRQVKVVVDIPGAELDGPPELKTAAANVTLPRSSESKITDETALTARVDPASLVRLSPGRKETLTGVTLTAPPDLAGIKRLRIDPPTVDVALTLRTKTASVKVASVPVHIRIAPSELSKWDIDIPEQDRFLTDVTISGPGDQVKQIQDKTVPLVATVSLSFEELERGIPSKEAVFCDLPTGLRFDVANKIVRLKIRKREAPAATPAGGPKPS